MFSGKKQHLIFKNFLKIRFLNNCGYSCSICGHQFILFGILLSALAIRIAFSIFIPLDYLAGDSAYYHFIAENLSHGKGYSLNGIEPTYIRPPTYPAFMALIHLVFGPNPKAVIYVQIVIGTITTLLTYFLACRIFSKPTGLLAAFLVAFYPALIYYDNRILRESLTALLLVTTVFFAIRSSQAQRSTWNILITGTFLAVLSLCRVEMLLLVFPIGYLLFRPIKNFKSRWRPVFLMLFPILLVWIPWTARNYIIFGTLSPVRSGLGSVLWFGSRWAENGGDNHTQEARKALQDEVRTLSKNRKLIDQIFMERALQDILQRPGWFLHMAYRKLIFFWKDANGVRKTLPAIHPFLAHFVNTYYYFLLALAVVGITINIHRKKWVIPLASIVGTYMLTYTFLHVRNRYRVPLLPLIFVLSAGGFWTIYDLIKTWGRIKLDFFPSQFSSNHLNQLEWDRFQTNKIKKPSRGEPQ